MFGGGSGDGGGILAYLFGGLYIIDYVNIRLHSIRALGYQWERQRGRMQILKVLTNECRYSQGHTLLLWAGRFII